MSSRAGFQAFGHGLDTGTAVFAPRTKGRMRVPQTPASPLLNQSCTARTGDEVLPRSHVPDGHLVLHDGLDFALRLLSGVLTKLLGLRTADHHRLLALPEGHADASAGDPVDEQERAAVSAQASKRRQRVSVLLNRGLACVLADANSRCACVQCSHLRFASGKYPPPHTNVDVSRVTRPLGRERHVETPVRAPRGSSGYSFRQRYLLDPMPHYLVWIDRDNSMEAPAAYASTHPVALGDLITVEREPCRVDRIESPPDDRYDAVIYAHRG